MIEFSCRAALNLAAEYAGKRIKEEDTVVKCIADYAKQCNAVSCNAKAADGNEAIVFVMDCSLVDFIRGAGQLSDVLKQFGSAKIIYADDKIHVNITIDL